MERVKGYAKSKKAVLVTELTTFTQLSHMADASLEFSVPTSISIDNIPGVPLEINESETLN